MNKFYLVGIDDRTIEGKSFLKIAVIQLPSQKVFNIYKIKDSSIFSKLSSLKTFDDVTDKIVFVIKSNGSIGLDIK